ncbi:MAG: type I methionyl aminopeptidase [candidate division Zixibacteria bacterium]|nr:type I methionyl aminopeptidase [candidate division Zixibacteria bacterium]
MIIYKSANEIKKIRASGSIVAQTIKLLFENIKPGITTAELDKMAEDFIRSKKAVPSFKGYNGFPASICASIDDEVVHGIPGSRVLEEGQVIGIDVGAYKDGYHGDSAWTITVGKVSDEAKKQIKVGEECLWRGIEQARVGNQLGDIGHAIQAHAEKNGYSVVRDLVGHGVGRKLHEDPQVPHYGKQHTGLTLRSGLVIAIEPMINDGVYQVKLLNDNWTIVTADGKRSVHFEHTIAVSENGPVILTE